MINETKSISAIHNEFKLERESNLEGNRGIIHAMEEPYMRVCLRLRHAWKANYKQTELTFALHESETPKY